ncbi:MAG: hypothetical protein JO069_06700 [Verrucomicrobia bacterium]|nr:hypothetical protein [Verrucomicrobiota bacterium]
MNPSDDVPTMLRALAERIERSEEVLDTVVVVGLSPANELYVAGYGAFGSNVYYNQAGEPWDHGPSQEAADLLRRGAAWLESGGDSEKDRL